MFLDANVLIHAYDSASHPGPACARLMERIGKGEQQAATSILVVNEVLYFFSQKYDLERAEKVLGYIRHIPNLRILSLEEKDLDRAMECMRAGLETTDAFHMATMKSNGISVICSYDKAFDKMKDIRRQEPK